MENQVSGDSFLGIIIWAEADGRRGVLADMSGVTWQFFESLPEYGTFSSIPVYQDGWRPTSAIRKNPFSGKEFIHTDPEIVEFSIQFFMHKNGNSGYKITSIRPALEYTQEDYEKLMTIRENEERKKFLERQKKREIRCLVK